MSTQKHKSRYLVSAAGHVPPEEAVAKLMDENKSYAGFVSITETGEGDDKTTVLEHFSVSGDSYPPLKEMMEQLTEYKDCLCAVVFGDNPKDADGDSEQPFVVLREDDIDPESPALLVALIDANSPNLAKSGDDPHAQIAEMLNNAFVRFLQASSDMDELVEAIQTDPKLPKMIEGLYDGRCSITIFAENGANWTWGTNPDRFEFPDEAVWMSHSEGYGTKSIAEKVTGAVRRFGGKGGKGGAATAADKGGATDAGKEAGGKAGAAQGNDTHILIGPEEKWTKEQKRSFYKQLNSGTVPTGFKDGPKIKVLKSKYYEWKPSWDQDYAHIGKEDEVVSSNTDDKVEIILKAPPAELKEHKDVFMKRPVPMKIVNEGRTIIDPKRFQATEDTYAKYSEVAGLSGTVDLFTYDLADWQQLITKTPVLAMMAIHELVAYGIDLTAEDLLNTKKEEEVVEEPEKKTGTTGGARKFGRK